MAEEKVPAPCMNCGYIPQVPKKLAGKKIQCPKCKKAIAVPSAGRRQKVASQQQERQTQVILKAFGLAFGLLFVAFIGFQYRNDSPNAVYVFFALAAAAVWASTGLAKWQRIAKSDGDQWLVRGWWVVLILSVLMIYKAGTELYERTRQGHQAGQDANEQQHLEEVRRILSDPGEGQRWLAEVRQQGIVTIDEGKLIFSAQEWGRGKYYSPQSKELIVAQAGAAGFAEVLSSQGQELLGTSNKAAGTVELLRAWDRH